MIDIGVAIDLIIESIKTQLVILTVLLSHLQGAKSQLRVLKNHGVLICIKIGSITQRR